MKSQQRGSGNRPTEHRGISSQRREKYLEELREESEREPIREPNRSKGYGYRKWEAKRKRPLGIPVVKDRIVQTALRNVLEPIFEKIFAEQSYGVQTRTGVVKMPSDEWKTLLKTGKTWVVDADIKSYFDSYSTRQADERHQRTGGRRTGIGTDRGIFKTRSNRRP